MKEVLIAVLFVVLSLTGCTNTQTFSRKVFEDPVLMVRLDSPLFPREEKTQPYSHPIEFTPQDLSRLLQSIKIQKEVSLVDYYVFRRDNSPFAPFPPEMANLLAPHLRTALAKAQAEEMVVFVITRSREDHIPLLTSGGLFVQGTQLSVILANVDRPAASEKKREEARQRPLKPLGKPDFHFVPGPFQTILAKREPPGVLSHDFAPLTLLLNYHEFLRRKPSTTRKPDPTIPSPAAESPAPSSTVQKLRQLKSWYEEGLISEPEYQKKRKEILDSF